MRRWRGPTLVVRRARFGRVTSLSVGFNAKIIHFSLCPFLGTSVSLAGPSRDVPKVPELASRCGSIPPPGGLQVVLDTRCRLVPEVSNKVL